MRQVEFKCPECKGQLDKDNNETYCIKCGLVVDEGIDFTHEVHPLDKEFERHRRVGPPLTDTLYDKGLFTLISKKIRGR